MLLSLRSVTPFTTKGCAKAAKPNPKTVQTENHTDTRQLPDIFASVGAPGILFKVAFGVVRAAEMLPEMGVGISGVTCAAPGSQCAADPV